LTNLCVFGQRTVEVSLDDLKRINRDFGLDSLEKLVGEIPIWALDTATSISILKSISPTGDRYSWGHKFVREMGSTVKSTLNDTRLKQSLVEEIRIIKDTDIKNKGFQSPSDEILSGLLFQNAQDLETIFENHLKELNLVAETIEKYQPKSKVKYFFKGSPEVVWNKYEISLSKFKILCCLNKLNPSVYTTKMLEEQRAGLHSFKKDYELVERPRVSCYNYKDINAEETEIKGVMIPTDILTPFNQDGQCMITKIKKDNDHYIVQINCRMRGDTFLTTRANERLKLCVLKSWIS